MTQGKLPEKKNPEKDMVAEALAMAEQEQARANRLLGYMVEAEQELGTLMMDFMNTYPDNVQPHTKLRWQQLIEGLRQALEARIKEEGEQTQQQA